MSHIWFRPLGWIYRPVSVAGWLVTIITLGLCVQFLVAVDRHSHSVSDTLIGVFPYAALFLIFAGWIASHTSPPRGG
ncbi:MAG: hypothetical protein M3068_10580 [Gemmatimonadota bacterium]|nr:hypothetical protein [Gemmatimonadota bacterium]